MDTTGYIKAGGQVFRWQKAATAGSCQDRSKGELKYFEKADKRFFFGPDVIDYLLSRHNRVSDVFKFSKKSCDELQVFETGIDDRPAGHGVVSRLNIRGEIVDCGADLKANKRETGTGWFRGALLDERSLDIDHQAVSHLQ